jgi:hypothetical protein
MLMHVYKSTKSGKLIVYILPEINKIHQGFGRLTYKTQHRALFDHGASEGQETGAIAPVPENAQENYPIH